MITTKQDRGTEVYVDSVLITIVTDATPRDALARFIDECKKHEEELQRVVAAAEEKRQWNFANPGKGKNWPELRAKERLVDKLAREAGIKDS